MAYSPVYEGVPFTDFASVTPDTPLHELDLNWRERDLPESMRTKHVHRFHPYLGKYIPQLVEIFLRKYFTKGQTILDPFCGSGTSLVQANELGINSIGFDVSAFNVLLSRVKTASYDQKIVKLEVYDVLERVRQHTPSMSEQLLLELRDPNNQFNLIIPEEENAYLQDWFTQQSLQELLAYRWFVEVGNYRYKDLLRIILSRSARSARLAPHYELDFPKTPQKEPYWCHKHSRTCVPTNGALKFLERYSIDALRRIQKYAEIRTDAIVDVRHVDSKLADVPPLDGVITSPPYVGLIDYHEQHSYAYNLLNLPDNRHDEIGPAVSGSGQYARSAYKELIATVFKRIIRSMQPGGRLIVVAGDRHGLYPEIAADIGVDVEAIIKRHVNRRTGRRTSDFYESVFVWRVT